MKKKFALLISAILAATMLAGVMVFAGVQSSPPNARQRLNQLLKTDGFVYGIQLAWNGDMGYSSDIGGTYKNGYRTGFNEALWTEKLYNCKVMGFNMVRFWLSEGMEGIQFDENGGVIGIEPTFRKNLTTLLTIADGMGLNVSLTLVPHLSMSAQSKADYDLSTRFIFNPEYTEGYIKNFVNPLMEIVAGYDNILLMDIYAEPEGDTYGMGGNGVLDRGTTWENMTRFIRDVGAAVKKCNPNMPITANSGWRESSPLLAGKYDELGLDYIGIDVYNDYGEVDSARKLKLNTPVMAGEFGVSNHDNWSDDFYSQTIEKFFQNAKEGGYKGAFMWMYGFPGETQSNNLVDKNGELRPVAVSLRFSALSREYERTGYTGLDKPAFMYLNSTLNIRWFGSRGAERYKLERSTDKKTWTLVANITNPQDYEYSSYIYRYQDKTAEQNNVYYYRVTSFDSDGQIAVSDPSNTVKFPRITCSDEENLVKNHSFESGATNWTLPTTGDVPGTPDMNVVMGTPGKEVYSGTKAIHVVSTKPWESNLEQEITVKPNTTYTFTVYYKIVKGSTVFKILNADGSVLGGDRQPTANGLWNYSTFDFNSGNNSRLRILWADGESEVYVDDFYVFKKEGQTTPTKDEETILKELDSALKQEAETYGVTDAMLTRSQKAEGNRARLAKAMEKARRGETVTIGFIGGSITEGTGASSSSKRYVNRIADWWQQAFPQAGIQLVNAGIGASDSVLGVHRVQEDILDAAPDVVIVDYAVNDNPDGETNLLQKEAYENLIRRLLKAPSSPAVILLFMMEQTGKSAQGAQSEIGAHYDLPMISYKDAVWPEVQSGKYTWSQLSADSVHPTDMGHGMIALFVGQYLTKTYRSLASVDRTVPSVPAPLISDRFESARILDSADLTPTATGAFSVMSSPYRKWKGWTAGGAGQSMELTLPDCHRVFLLLKMDTQGSTATVTVNQGAAIPVNSNAGFTYSWESTLLMDSAQPAQAKLRITPSGTFTVLGVLVS